MRRLHGGLLALLVSSVGLPSAALAAPIVQDSSFETPPASGGFVAGDPSPWVSTGFTGDGVDTAAEAGLAGADGTQYFYGDGGAYTGVLSQNLGVGFQPDTTYTVDLSAAYRNTPDNPNFGGANINFGLESSTSAPLPGAQVGFISDDNLYAAGTNQFFAASAIGGISNIFSFTTGPVAPLGDIVAYIAGAGNLSQTGRIQVDNFVLTAASSVPEPTSWVLLGPGAAGLFLAAPVAALVKACHGQRPGTFPAMPCSGAMRWSRF